MPLRLGEIVEQPGVVAQLLRLDVLSHADHVAARHGVGAHLDALTDRILAGPEGLGHRVAHHHGPGRMLRVLCADAAASQDARTERGEVLRGHGVEIELAQSVDRSEEHTSELQSPCNLVCRLLLEKKKKQKYVGRSGRRPYTT